MTKKIGFLVCLSLAVIVSPSLAQTQSPANDSTYFGSRSGVAADPGSTSSKAPVANAALQGELQQLAAQHVGEVTQAVDTVNRIYHTALASLAKRAQDAGDTQTTQKIKDIIAMFTNLDGTTWHQNGNAWVAELRFHNGTMTVVPKNGPWHDTAYRLENNTVFFAYDSREQRIEVAPDRTSLSWAGTVLNR